MPVRVSCLACAGGGEIRTGYHCGRRVIRCVYVFCVCVSTSMRFVLFCYLMSVGLLDVLPRLECVGGRKYVRIPLREKWLCVVFCVELFSCSWLILLRIYVYKN